MDSRINGVIIVLRLKDMRTGSYVSTNEENELIAVKGNILGNFKLFADILDLFCGRARRVCRVLRFYHVLAASYNKRKSKTKKKEQRDEFLCFVHNNPPEIFIILFVFFHHNNIP